MLTNRMEASPGELQELPGYADWRNFLNAIDKAKESCETTGAAVSDHFVDVTKMVKIGSGAERKQDDIMLTRYACYLIAQNGDPKKEQIAFAQSYFAIQTKKQELLEERIRLMERLQAREKLAADLHKMEHFFRVKLTNGYISLQQRIKLLLSSTPQQRYEEFSKQYPDLLQRIPKKYIAEFLGVSRETLSRLYSNGK